MQLKLDEQALPIPARWLRLLPLVPPPGHLRSDITLPPNRYETGVHAMGCRTSVPFRKPKLAFMKSREFLALPTTIYAGHQRRLIPFAEKTREGRTRDRSRPTRLPADRLRCLAPCRDPATDDASRALLQRSFFGSKPNVTVPPIFDGNTPNTVDLQLWDLWLNTYTKLLSPGRPHPATRRDALLSQPVSICAAGYPLCRHLCFHI